MMKSRCNAPLLPRAAQFCFGEKDGNAINEFSCIISFSSVSFITCSSSLEKNAYLSEPFIFIYHSQGFFTICFLGVLGTLSLIFFQWSLLGFLLQHSQKKSQRKITNPKIY